MDNHLLQTILQNTYTWTDLHHRFGLLQEFLEKETFLEHRQKTIGKSLDEFLTDAGESSADKAAFLEWGEAFYNSFTTENTYSKLSELAVAIEELPVLTLYVAVFLPPEEVEKLALWVRTNIGPNVVIDLLVDAELAIGCAFVWEGVYHDFSLKYFMHQHREEFVKKIREYAYKEK